LKTLRFQGFLFVRKTVNIIDFSLSEKNSANCATLKNMIFACFLHTPDEWHSKLRIHPEL